MKYFIVLSIYQTGKPIYFKIDKVSAVRQDDKYTAVTIMGDEGAYVVSETAKDIVAELEYYLGGGK